MRGALVRKHQKQFLDSLTITAADNKVFSFSFSFLSLFLSLSFSFFSPFFSFSPSSSSAPPQKPLNKIVQWLRLLRNGTPPSPSFPSPLSYLPLTFPSLLPASETVLLWLRIFAMDRIDPLRAIAAAAQQWYPSPSLLPFPTSPTFPFPSLPSLSYFSQ